MDKFAVPITYEEKDLLNQLAQDLVDTHNDTGINLDYWPAAREFVVRWYIGHTPIKPGRPYNGD